MIDTKLIEKYDKPLPRYTSYPPATKFHSGFTGNDFIESVKASNSQQPEGISLYIHIPFCPQLCLYCGCTNLITQKSDLIEEYVSAIIKEIVMVSQWLDKSRAVTQIHWGGGTPNALNTAQIGTIMAVVSKTFKLNQSTEIAMECHPGHLTVEYLDDLFKMGFNRISLGIQDFNQEVLKLVRRLPSKLPIEELAAHIKKNGAGLNFDFIYGLPGQTVESFTETIEKALLLEPDRLVTFSYAHVPWVKPHQSKLEEIGLPTAKDKLEMFSSTYKTIVRNPDYVAIGLDHFAHKNDSLSNALKSHKLHRNFQGYCTRETTGQVYAFGMSAISQTYNAYAQNIKDTRKYIEQINSGKAATDKGYSITDEELIIKEVITELMCNNYLNWNNLAVKLNTTSEKIKQTTQYSIEKMKPFIDDELILIDNDSIAITETGRFTIRNIVAELDPKLKTENNQFSKSI